MRTLCNCTSRAGIDCIVTAYAVFFAIALALTSPAHAALTPVTLVNTTPSLSDLTACIIKRLSPSAPVVDAAAMVAGLEFRIAQRDAGNAPPILTITALLKPDVNALIASHDDDPEAHPEVAARVYRMLRVHIGTRAWLWSIKHQNTVCSAAAGWINALRARPVLLDRLGADGELMR